MAKSSKRNHTLTAGKNQQYQTTELTRSYSLDKFKNLKTREATLSTNKTKMTRTNSHRKIRKSREQCCSKLKETLHIKTSALIYPKKSLFLSSARTPSSSTSSLSALLVRHSCLRNSCWKCAMVISLLVVLGSSQVISGLTQSNHSTLIKMTEEESTTSIALARIEEAMERATAFPVSKYSQPFKGDDNSNEHFRPIIPKNINREKISQNIFGRTEQHRVFEPVDSELRLTLLMERATDGTASVFPVENRKSFGTQSEILTLQAKRKSASQRKEVVQGREGSNGHREDFKFGGNKTKVSEQTIEILEQTKLNQSIPKTKPFHQTPIDSTTDGRHIDVRSKQLHSSVLNVPTENTTTSIAGIHNKQNGPVTDIKGLENLLANYVDDFFNRGQYQPKPELILALQQNFTGMKENYEEKIKNFIPDEDRRRPVRQVFEKRPDGQVNVNIPRALESGRLLFFAGLKKVMWPIYMGLQVLKSLMFALLLPTLIGSFGKLLGKGISSGSAPLFIRPMDEPQELDFRDNSFNFEDDGTKFSSIDDVSLGGNVKGGGHAYNQAEASQTHNQYVYNAAAINQQALSRYGMNERQQLMQDSYLSALQSLGAASFKNSNGFSGSSSGGGGGGGGGLAGVISPMRQKPAPPANMNTFQQFQKVPASSLLLSNYDPFYSPLLSRLDSVFAQLKLKSDDEACREKLICLMYANPAKYAPYSNLVSAQLSRELNELRKPTSDNPDILRFFKYMRAAKDGQDGVDCESSFEKCKEFKDFENPAMVSTYHDINKLVQARKFT